jgi:hypothetical protein
MLIQQPLANILKVDTPVLQQLKEAFPRVDSVQILLGQDGAWISDFLQDPIDGGATRRDISISLYRNPCRDRLQVVLIRSLCLSCELVALRHISIFPVF